MTTTMGSRQKRPRRLIGPLAGGLVVAYFAYHALHGERGLFAYLRLSERVAVSTAHAEKIRIKRNAWERRVRALSGAALDLDMLEERVRVMLNMGHQRDRVILVQTEAE